MIELPLYKVLKDQTRQKILNMIGEKGSVSYTDMLSSLNVSTGKLNYHLRILSPFVQKNNGSYTLSETGENAYAIMKKFDTDQKISNYSIYRSLSWLFLAVSAMLLFIAYPPLQILGSQSAGSTMKYVIVTEIIGLIVMLIAVFFFYSSGNTKTSIPEMTAILALALFIGSIGAFCIIRAYNNYTFGFFSGFSPLSTIGAVIIFSTFVGWTLSNRRRWIFAVLLMLSISIFFAVVLILEMLTTSGYSEIDIAFPMPALFLAVTAVSTVARRFNFSTSQGNTEADK